MTANKGGPAVSYTGPQATFASLTGSPFWGLGVEGVIAAAEKRGWQHHRSERLPTPYGLGPWVNHFTTPAGRSILWIPSYGEVVGEDALYHRNVEKAFWILWQAGVRVLLVGGTSGVADWRTGDAAIHPGDVVLPWSFHTRSFHRGLPGTEFESVWSKGHLLLGKPFCPAGTTELATQFEPFIRQGQLRRLHTPQDARVALVVPEAITFETDFDILMWLAVSKTASDLQPHLPPVVTLHGDCVNPILARYLGIHLFYYHLVSNYAQGLAPQDETAHQVRHLYTRVFPEIALEVELNLLESVPVPAGDTCSCTSSWYEAPPAFRQTLTR